MCFLLSYVKFYNNNKHKIKDIYDLAYIGEDDKIFDVSVQKEFYKNRLHIVKNAFYNIFYKIKNYSQIIDSSLL